MDQAMVKECSAMNTTLSIDATAGNYAPETVADCRRGLFAAFMDLCTLSPDMGVATRRGSSHEVNQDSWLMPAPGFPVIAVADGVSKSNQGENASCLALMPFGLSRETGCRELEQLVFAANDWVKQCYRLFDQERVGQTTLVAGSIKRGAVAHYISIGDSRVYLLQPKGFFRRGFICRQVSTDQTHGERKKRVTYKQPERYRDDMMIHAIGAGLIRDEVQARSLLIPPGGLLLFATDGLFKGMGDADCEHIARLAAEHCGKSAADIAEALVSEAAVNFDTGDDITVAVVVPAYLAGARWPFWTAAVLVLAGLLGTAIC